jgi:hypothetical protein
VALNWETEIPNEVYTKYGKKQMPRRLTEYCMPPDIERLGMADGRALLTDREREILSGDADVSDNYRYKVESTARQRIRQLEADVTVLREHHPEIFAELQNTVCVPDE